MSILDRFTDFFFKVRAMAVSFWLIRSVHDFGISEACGFALDEEQADAAADGIGHRAALRCRQMLRNKQPSMTPLVSVFVLAVLTIKPCS
ncbi:MAG: hypothetical protein VBE63_20925 [Lamprobacter sp.]|uniref:hypothetical protein n=1 Tax=Lamprobacter sp. TaxID=3100796 RepID=UPI002B263B5B|nr:hypothetical protein [Lamprobacter sp.]MEA3642383.1 hypothetical protein [Lamprobacter sp.]